MLFKKYSSSLASGREAFTLVEALVVLVVLAVIVAIGLPRLLAVREEGRMSHCSANLHALGQGLVRYAADRHDKLPRYDNNGTTWSSAILPYINEDKTLFVCPADPLRARGLPNLAPRSYACNGAEESPESGMYPFGSGLEERPLTFGELAPSAEQVILLGERPGKVEHGRYTMDRLIRGYVGRVEYASLDQLPGRVHHGGKGCNYLFADLSVSYLTAEKVAGGEKLWTIPRPPEPSATEEEEAANLGGRDLRSP